MRPPAAWREGGAAARPRRLALVALLAASLTGACGGGSSGSPSPPFAPADTGSSVPTLAAPRSPDSVTTAAPCPTAGSCPRLDVALWRSVPFTPPVACSGAGATCQLLMDVRAPTSGGPWPLVVLLPGGPDPPAEFRSPEVLARLLAARGAVVMNTAWRQGIGDGGGYPTSFADVACAIGVARRIGPAYGAAPDRVVLVGHSLGGWAGAVVALTPAEFVPADGSCDETAGSLRPDAFVGIAAASDLLAVQQPGPDWVRAFLGGDRAERPDAWAAADPFELVARHAAAQSGVPILLVHGGRDRAVNPATSVALDTALRAGGAESRLVVVPSADHGSILSAPETVEAIMALLNDR